MTTYFGMTNVDISKQYTFHAIKSFFNNTNLSDGDRFYLIDNDNSYSENLPSEVTVIKNEVPLSFSKNVNQIMRLALENNADLCFLNNDLIFTDGWYSKLVKSNNLNRVSIPICNEHECLPPFRSAMNLNDFLGKEDKLQECSRYITSRNEGLMSTPLRIGFYCFYVPNRVLREIGLFNENMINAGEDIDYRIRCHMLGVEVKLIHDSYVLHFMGKSTWRSGESKVLTSIRDDHSRSTFISRWGYDLYGLFMLRNPNDSISMIKQKQLYDYYLKGDYTHIIKQLRKNTT